MMTGALYKAVATVGMKEKRQLLSVVTVLDFLALYSRYPNKIPVSYCVACLGLQISVHFADNYYEIICS